VAGTFSRYILENPWPLAIASFAIAGVLGWKALSEGERRFRDIALVAFGLGITVSLLGTLVTTAAERGKAVVAELVDRAERGDITGMLSLMTEDCLLHYGSPENVGRRRSDWESTIGFLRGTFTIDSNSITKLDAESDGRKAARVDLACLTNVSLSPYPVPSVWWIRVAEQPNGEWKIDRIAALKIGGNTPGPGSF
jgi:hypothetical protein